MWLYLPEYLRENVSFDEAWGHLSNRGGKDGALAAMENLLKLHESSRYFDEDRREELLENWAYEFNCFNEVAAGLGPLFVKD